MGSDEFIKYMDRQILEIEKYKNAQSKNNTHLDSNECVFEWIRKNAKSFRDKWVK